MAFRGRNPERSRFLYLAISHGFKDFLRLDELDHSLSADVLTQAAQIAHKGVVDFGIQDISNEAPSIFII